MLAKRLIYITDRGVRAYRWFKGKLTQTAEFAGGDEPQLEAFEAWLQEERRAPLFIIADLIEIDFRVEIMPHASFTDARQMRQRKLSSIYRSSPFRNALNLGRELTGRRDDRVLLSAITNPDALTPWLPAIERCKAPLAGICAPPLLLDKAAKTWATEHTLLVTRDNDAGLRLTYFFAGELRFSRLTPHLETAIEELAPVLIEEVARTQQYLLNLRLLGRDDTLHIFVADQPVRLSEWQTFLHSSKLLHFDTISLPELAKTTDAPGITVENTAADLFITLAAQGFARNHYGAASHLHEAYLRLIRILLQGAVLAMSSMGIILMAYDGYVLYDLQQQIGQTQINTGLLEAKYQKIKSSFPPAPASAEAMHEADTAIQKLQKEQAAPRALLSEVSKGLDAAPAIKMTRLTWRYGKPEETTGSTENVQPTAQTSAVANAVGDNENDKRWHVLIEGEIPHTIKQREALAAVDSFVKAVASKEISVEVLRLPYNIRPDASLKGQSGISADGASAGNPSVAIRAVWNTPPADN